MKKTLTYTFDSEGKSIVGVIIFAGKNNITYGRITGYIVLEPDGKTTRKVINYNGTHVDAKMNADITKFYVEGKSKAEAYAAVFGKSQADKAGNAIDHIYINEMRFDIGMALTGIKKTISRHSIDYSFITKDFLSASNATKEYTVKINLSGSPELNTIILKEAEPQKIITYIKDDQYETGATVTLEIKTGDPTILQKSAREEQIAAVAAAAEAQKNSGKLGKKWYIILIVILVFIAAAFGIFIWKTRAPKITTSVGW